MATRVYIVHVFAITAILVMLFACEKKQVRWISEPSYFVPSMDPELLQYRERGEVLHFGESVMLVEETKRVIFFNGQAVIHPATGDTAYWTKILRQGKEGYTFSNVLSDSAFFFQDEPPYKGQTLYQAQDESRSIARIKSSESGEQHFWLTNTKSETLKFDLEDLKDLLLSNNWSNGLLKLHFEPDLTCIWEAEDSYTGKWYLTEYGEVILYESLEAKDPTSVLRFDNTFTLVSKESGRAYYYSLEYYESFAVSPESQKAIEIPLPEIDESSLIGTWVIADGAQDGLLLGYKFVGNDFYVGDNLISDLRGYWDDADYRYRGSWHYDKSLHTIKMVYIDSKDDTTTISINKFYNAAFDGVIKSTRYINEGGEDSPRTFYKSKGKFDRDF